RRGDPHDRRRSPAYRTADYGRAPDQPARGPVGRGGRAQCRGTRERGRRVVTTGNGWPGADGPLRGPGPSPRVAPPSVGPQHQAPRPPPAAPPVAAPPPVAPPRPAPPPSTAAAARAATVGPGSRRGGRRARLVVKRIDPWSTLKFSFVYSLAGLVVVLVAAAALYAIVDAMGVIDSIRSFLRDVEGSKS